jgi:hypothetical protein
MDEETAMAAAELRVAEVCRSAWVSMPVAIVFGAKLQERTKVRKPEYEGLNVDKEKNTSHTLG